MKNNTLNEVGIVMATKLEASPFINNLKLSLQEKKPFNLYKNSNMLLIISGIGKSNAAMAASYLIYKYNIQTLLNIGAAGSTVSDFDISDIFQINKIIELDRIDIKNYKPVIYETNTIESFENTTLATQDKPVISKDNRKNVSQFAQLVDMEGAGFIHACQTFSAKSLIFKIVTDTPEENSVESIVKNIKKTRNILFDFIIKKVLKKISNK